MVLGWEDMLMSPFPSFGWLLFEDWLVDKFDLDLSLVARLGGHSQPRTHRGKDAACSSTPEHADSFDVVGGVNEQRMGSSWRIPL